MPSKTLYGRYVEQIEFFEKRQAEGKELLENAAKKRRQHEEEHEIALTAPVNTIARSNMLFEARKTQLQAKDMEEKGRQMHSQDEYIEYLLDIAPMLLQNGREVENVVNCAGDDIVPESVAVQTNIRGKKSHNMTMRQYMQQPSSGCGGTAGVSRTEECEIDQDTTSKKGELFEKFVYASKWHEDSQRELESKKPVVNPSYSENDLDLVCATCKVNKIVCSAEATAVCPCCGLSQNYQEFDLAAIPHDDAPFIADYSYKRENHLTELLNQFTGRSLRVPEDVIHKLKQEMKKHKIAETNIDSKVVRQHLKRLKLSKYYDQAHIISQSLGGKKVPEIPMNIQAKIRVMFMAIQKPFETAKEKVAGAKGRRNMLHYGFCMGKMFQLLGLDDLSECVPTLKSREKLMLAEQVWKHICEELKWQYIPPK